MSTKGSAAPKVKALLFDVFGTAVDWRTTVTRDLHRRCQITMYLPPECSMTRTTRDKAVTMDYPDWERFALEWRAMYYAFCTDVAAQSMAGTSDPSAYRTIDQFQYDSLLEMLDKWGLTNLWPEVKVKEVSRIWHALDGWADSAEGLRALNRLGLETCTLSNGNVELLTDMAKHADLEWSHVFSAEMWQSYKPDPKVYRGAVEKLGLIVEECAMVACHLGDLNAARACGLKTFYVEREGEEAWSKERAEEARAWVDIWVSKDEDGFLTLAERIKQS